MTEPRVVHEFVVEAAEDAKRLDVFLHRRIPKISRSLIQKHIDSGAVTVGAGHVASRASTLVRTGEHVRYIVPPATPLEIAPEPIPLDVLYEDDDVVVIQKPRGLVVHPAAGHPGGTLVNALLASVQGLSGVGGKLRPGIVHRLDRDTTGVMVIAKNDHAHHHLSQQWKARTVIKRYIAVVFGHPKPESGTIETLIGRHPSDRKRMSSKVKRGRNAITHYRIEERFEDASLIYVSIETGRTHQIRVHFADRGHPLVGDRVYGPRRPIVFGFDRPALHAERLVFAHPTSNERLEFVAPLPADLRALVEALRK